MTPGAPPVYACTTCREPLPAGSDRCARCGALSGDFRRCYGCGARAEVIQKDGGMFVCAACGRPRVPVEKPGFAPSGNERPALERAARSHRDAIISRVGGIMAFVVAAILAVTALLPLFLGWTAFGLTVVGLAALIAFVGGFGVVNAKKNRTQAVSHMTDAIASVALDLMKQRGALSPRMVSDQLGIPEDVAEKALNKLPADPRLRVETVIDERAADGQLRYRLDDAGQIETAGMSEEEAEKASFDARLAAATKAKGQS
ncbi:MAG: hypothetical protein ABI175_09280 [Polyangiales bacterium]